MKQVLEKAKKIHYILHYEGQVINSSMLILIYIIYQSQLLNQIGYFTPKQDVSSIYNLIKGLFIFPIIPDRYYPISLIILFIINIWIIFFTIMLLLMNHKKQTRRWIFIINIMNVVLTIYIFVFYISNLWISFKLLFTSLLIYSIISLVNIFLTLFITLIILYFQRQDSLQENENATTSIILVQIIMKMSELLAVYFHDDTISFIIITAILLIKIFNNFRKISELSQQKITLNILTLCFGLTLKYSFWLMDYLTLITLMLFLKMQLYDKQFQQILHHSETISGCQLAEKLYSKCLTDKSARIQLQIFKINHKCLKCVAFYDIIECILKKKSQTYTDKLVYSNFIYKKWPLRALVELQRDQCDNYYYQSALQTLKLKYQQQQISEIIQTTYKSQIVSDQIIKSFIKLIDELILFWSSTIMNEFGIEEFYQGGRKLGQHIQRIITQMDSIYDIDKNKLKEMETSDIISLKLLQVYYCIVNVNLVKAQIMEDKIVELFRNDKFKSFTIDNNIIASNRMLLLTTSLIKNQFKLINPKYNQMSLFLNVALEEVQSLSLSSDIMPPFVAEIHEQLIENFIQKSSSKLMQQGEATYYQDLQGYIVPCNIHILPQQTDDDYQVNAILTKEQGFNEQIIFGINGKLLGITQSFFEFSQSSSYIDNYTKAISVNDLICKGSLIQYYVDNILDHISTLKQSIERHQNTILPEVQSYWKYPDNHAYCVMNTQNLLQQSSQIQRVSFSNFISQKTYLQTSEPSKTLIPEDISEIYNKDYIVEGVEWQLLGPNYNDSIRQMMQTYNTTVSQKTNVGKTIIIYSLQFKKIYVGKNMIGYFIMEIKEYRQELTQYSSSINQTNLNKSEKSQSPTFQISEFDDINSEKTGTDELVKQIQQINQKNHLVYLNKLENDKQQVINNISSMTITRQKMQSYDFENSSRLLKIQTDRQPKKQLLTTKIELQSFNVQDDDDIIQVAEHDFQDIIGDKIYNQADDYPLEVLNKHPKNMLEKQQTKVQDKNSLRPTNKQQNQLQDSVSYLETLSSNQFTLSSLKRFTYFSFCIVSLLFLTIILECNKNYQRIKSNNNTIIELRENLKFQRVLAGQYNILFSKLLLVKKIITIDQLQNQLIEKQGQFFFSESTYHNQFQFINNYNSDPIRGIELTATDFNLIYQQTQNQLVQMYQNTTQQQLNFNNNTHFIFNKIYQQISAQLNTYQDFSMDYIQIIVFIFLYIFFIVYQINYLYSKNKVIQKLLKLVFQTNIAKLQNQKARLQTCKEILQNTNSKNWKLSSFISIIQEDLHLEKNQKKQILDFENNLSLSYIYPSIVAISFLVLFVIGGGILQYIYYEGGYFKIEEQLIQLNLMIDQSLIFGSVIKGSNYLNLQISNYQYLIADFDETTSQQIQIVNNIIDQLEILQSNDIFNQLVGDFCVFNEQFIIQCSTNKQSYTEMLSIIEKGLISLTNNIVQIKRTEFIQELANMTINDDLLYLKSKSFLNTFIIYFVEIINVLDLQIEQVVQASKDEYNKYILLIFCYEIIVGIIIVFLYLIYGYCISMFHKKDFQQIILFLRTMPNEQIQLKNTLHQIKSIVQGK